MHASEVTGEVVERANELYWGSAESVNQIADDLDLSKGALYGIIEPEPSGRGCPLCGDEVVYANRTAKDRGMLACPSCDWDGTPEDAMAEPVEDAIAEPAEDDPAPPTREAGRTATGNDEARPTKDQEEDGPRSTGDQEDPPAKTDSDAASPSDRVPSGPLAHADARTVAGGALLGAAVGLALVLWARRR